MKKEIQLGDKVKDTITGFIGIAVARTIWIQGCDRITVQPLVNKNNNLEESMSFDEPSLIVISKKKTPKKRDDVGGPRPEPKLSTLSPSYSSRPVLTETYKHGKK